MLRFPRQSLVLPVLARDRGARRPAAPARRRRPSPSAPGRVTVEPRIADEAVGGAIADVAMGMVGTRYRYGGTDPIEGFDCSGLVYYAYGQAGYERAAHVARAVPRRAQDRGRRGRSRRSHVLPGSDEAVARRHLSWATGVRARARERPERRGREPRLAVLSSSTSSPSAGCCRTEAAAVRRALTANGAVAPALPPRRASLARTPAPCALRARCDACRAAADRGAPSRAR